MILRLKIVSSPFDSSVVLRPGDLTASRQIPFADTNRSIALSCVQFGPFVAGVR